MSAPGRRGRSLLLILGILGAAVATQLGAASSPPAAGAGRPSAVPTVTATPSPPPTTPGGSVPAPSYGQSPSPSAAQRPPDVQPPASPPPTPGSTVLDRGRQLYGSGCAGCHGQAGQGSSVAPPLLGVGAASTDFQLSTGRMPLSRVVKQPAHGAPAYGRSDTDAIVAYVSSLRPGGEPIPALRPGDAASGRRVYLDNCAACHSSTGVGAALPAGFIAPSLLQTDRTRVAEAVRVGPGLMPPFPASVLDDAQLADLVAYVGALRAEGSHGGWAIGSLGPVSEGLLGWVAGLGALLVVIRLLGKRAP